MKWEDIGGLEDVKNDIKDTVQLPLMHPDLFSSGMKRSGQFSKFGLEIILLCINSESLSRDPGLFFVCHCYY